MLNNKIVKSMMTLTLAALLAAAPITNGPTRMISALAAETDQTQERATTSYYMGDVDLDGFVTASDALTVLRHVVDLLELTGQAMTLADMDGNSIVEASDALAILQTVMNLKEIVLVEAAETITTASLTNEIVVDEDEGTLTYTATLTNTGETSLDAWTLYDTTINDWTFEGLDLQSVTAELGTANGWSAFYDSDNDWYITSCGERGWKVFCGSSLSDAIGVGEAIRVTAIYTLNGKATNIISTAEYTATGLDTGTEISGSTAAAVR